MFEVGRVAQLFTPCYKPLARKNIFISVVNPVPISCPISSLILWMSTDWTDPPESEKIIRSKKYILLVCKSYDTNTGFALFIPVSFYILTVALVCTYYAFKGRNIPENFKEAMYILPLSSIVLPCGVHVWKLARNTCFLFNDVSVCVWFVGLHFRAQSLHSSFPFPEKHCRMCQGAGVELFVFQRSRNKSSAQARQFWDT